jgi:pimeloyl-ACP methyl ester carboxylesterase
MTSPAYAARRPCRSEFVDVRGLRHHLHVWGDAAQVSTDKPILLMLHGWMDVAASFQFVIDCMGDDRLVIAPDWRGFGLTEWPKNGGTYFYSEYIADLDVLIDHLLPAYPGAPRLDLLGHSMGANVGMVYAGVRPERLRKVVNLEGFGLPGTSPDMAPARYATWLDELKEPAQLRGYPDRGAVADRLQKTNPLLPRDRAEWLAGHWAAPDARGEWQIRADPAHKRVNPMLYRKDEILACWRRITAPTMWAEGDRTEIDKLWGNRFSKAEFHRERLTLVKNVEKHVLSPAGHMLHHDQPETLAKLIDGFLGV